MMPDQLFITILRKDSIGRNIKLYFRIWHYSAVVQKTKRMEKTVVADSSWVHVFFGRGRALSSDLNFGEIASLL